MNDNDPGWVQLLPLVVGLGLGFGLLLWLALRRALRWAIFNCQLPIENLQSPAGADPRLHGPEFCPRVCTGCVCEDGRSRHHWLDAGFDPTEPEDGRDPDERAVLDYDRDHGTEHGLAYFQCSHCSAWAEAEYVWELEEAAQEEDGGEEVPG